MKNSKNKWLALALAAATLVSVTACGGNNSSSSSNTNTASESSASSSSKAEIREVSVIRPIPDDLKFPDSDTLDNNVWTRLYETELGIKLKFEWMTPVAQYEQKLNISIASNDIPDIFQVNSVQLKQLVEDEQLADLTEVYEKNASEYTKNVLNQDESALQSSTFDGKLLAIPKMGSGLGQTNVLWLRTDWLKKLNMEAPKTMDDLVKIAQSFTENDPDGNGAKDTFGFGINKDLWGMFASLEGFFNGYGAYPNTWIEDSSGKLANGNIQPEMKTALTSLKDMFKKGYIDPEFGVKDSFKVSANVGEGKIGMFYGLFWNMGWLSDAKAANPNMTWKPYSLVGTTEGSALAQVPFPISTYYVVNKKAANPEAIIDMLNLQLEKCFGKTAEPAVYNVDQAGNPIFEYPLIYSEPPMKNVDAQVKVSKALDSKDTAALTAEEKGYYDQILAYRGGDLAGWATEMMYGPESSLAIINGYATNKKVYPNRYFGPPTTTMTQKESTLSQIQLQTLTDIIMNGDLNQFEKYVADWKSLGGDAITEEVNNWQASRKK